MNLLLNESTYVYHQCRPSLVIIMVSHTQLQDFMFSLRMELMFLLLRTASVLDENSRKLVLAFCPSLADYSWKNQVAFCMPMCFMIPFFLFNSYPVLH